jgi:anti-sigma regulatory factor (Ser/Thr protein kinase)
MSAQELGSVREKASMDNWDRLNDFVNESISLGLKEKSRAYNLRLATEELISNIIRAASEVPSSDSKDVVLEISARTQNAGDCSWFILKTKDNGLHFDPQFASRLPVDTEQPVSERAIGGLGLFLIQQSVDKVTYEWSDECNVYELWVALDSSCAA